MAPKLHSAYSRRNGLQVEEEGVSPSGYSSASRVVITLFNTALFSVCCPLNYIGN